MRDASYDTNRALSDGRALSYLYHSLHSPPHFHHIPGPPQQLSKHQRDTVGPSSSSITDSFNILFILLGPMGTLCFKSLTCGHLLWNRHLYGRQCPSVERKPSRQGRHLHSNTGEGTDSTRTDWKLTRSRIMPSNQSSRPEFWRFSIILFPRTNTSILTLNHIGHFHFCPDIYLDV